MIYFCFYLTTNYNDCELLKAEKRKGESIRQKWSTVVPASKEDISNLKWPFCRVQTHTIHRLSDCMTKHRRSLFAHLTVPCYL